MNQNEVLIKESILTEQSFLSKEEATIMSGEILLKNGYKGEQLEILLSRILFCLFADDSGIFMPRDSFLHYIYLKTNVDGSDLGMHLNYIFQALDRSEEKRQENLDTDIDKFPYVNGMKMCRR